MEMKGIIEHSILEDDAEICSRAARCRRRGKYGGGYTRVRGGGGLNWCTRSNRTEAESDQPWSRGRRGRRTGEEKCPQAVICSKGD